MLEPSDSRVRLDPVSAHAASEFAEELVELPDGRAMWRVPGPWRLLLSLFLIALTLIAILGVRLGGSLMEIALWIAGGMILFLLLLSWHNGAEMTRLWTFAPSQVARELRLPLPARVWPRTFHGVTEFEIVHTLWTQGLLKRRLQGGHEDELRFRLRGHDRPMTVMVRGMAYSGGTLRGPGFMQINAREIEREILPDVLAVAALASRSVGVPLYVREKRRYVGSDSDG